MRARQLWGTDVYTEDSDLVAVLVHAGYYQLPPQGAAPPPGLSELRATLRALPTQAAYASTSRHGIRSRAWGGALRAGAPGAGGAPPPPAASASYRVERCAALMASGAVAELDPAAARAPGSSAPTFVLSASERSVHTRAASADAHRRQRFLREVTLQYSLCHEPWTKYTVAAVADRGLKRPQWTSARLRKEVLYLETHSARFELAWEGLTAAAALAEGPAATAAAEASGDAFRWARCVTPLPLEAARAAGAPLRPHDLAVLARGVAWEAIKWGSNGAAALLRRHACVRCARSVAMRCDAMRL